MKTKYLLFTLAALLAAGGWWFARSSWPHGFHKSGMSVGIKTPDGPPESGQMLHSPGRLAPPDPTRRFTEFTPEQRVEFARKGHGPGG